MLFDAARRAGVKRVVHVSITNPSESSPLPYFRGKARLERALRESGLAHAILRPAVLFGGGDILINNIAWALRTFPFLALFGDGTYRLDPIHVEDFADLAVALAFEPDNRIVNAIGPESFTYRELVTQIGERIGHRRPLVRVPPTVGAWCGRLIGWWQRDVFITREEIQGLMEGRLHVDTPPTGTTRLTDWVTANRETLGRRYASELARPRPPSGSDRSRTGKAEN
ncbi:MAG: SDR family oxidoreductase [Limisphaerales bacterium]